MKPALSIILFTTIASAAQGMAVVLAASTLLGVAPHGAMPPMLWMVTAMLLAALAASFFHVGHPMRAWRAALMWRTSWMSREVILLPVFIGLMALWAALSSAGRAQGDSVTFLAWLAIAGALLLWYAIKNSPDFSIFFKSCLVIWAVLVVVLPRALALPLARYVSNAASR